MEIHIARDGEQFGPFPPDEVRRQLAAGTLLPTDHAWSEGATAWVPLSSLPTLNTPPAAPVLAPWPQATEPMVATGTYRKSQTSGLAIASMVLGILAVTFVVPVVSAIAGIVCGHIARSGIRRSGGALAGDGMAVAGLVTSYIGLFISLLLLIFVFALIFAGMALPFFGAGQTRAKVTNSVVHASEIAAACHMYAVDHQHRFPKILDELVPKYLPDRQVFVCPLTGPSVPMGYKYFGGTDQDPGDKILLLSKYQDGEGNRVVVRVDSSAKFERPRVDQLPPGGR